MIKSFFLSLFVYLALTCHLTFAQNDIQTKEEQYKQMIAKITLDLVLKDTLLSDESLLPIFRRGDIVDTLLRGEFDIQAIIHEYIYTLREIESLVKNEIHPIVAIIEQTDIFSRLAVGNKEEAKHRLLEQLNDYIRWRNLNRTGLNAYSVREIIQTHVNEQLKKGTLNKADADYATEQYLHIIYKNLLENISVGHNGKISYEPYKSWIEIVSESLKTEIKIPIDRVSDRLDKIEQTREIWEDRKNQATIDAVDSYEALKSIL